MIAERLADVRRRMDKSGVDVLLVRSTDAYLNEYVPTAESTRVWISGFTGSMGEVVIARDRAYLVVDGRYWIQADKQTDPVLYEVVRVQHGTGIDSAVRDLLAELAEAHGGKTLKVGFEPDRITPRELKHLRDEVDAKCTFKPLFPSLVERARAEAAAANASEPPEAGVRAVDEARVGRTVADKLALLADWLQAEDLDALLVQRLDDIAYLSNLRGTELPYQATFKCVALVTPERLLIGIDPRRIPEAVRAAREDIAFLPEREFWRRIGKKTALQHIAYDPAHNTERGRLAIEKTGATAIAVSSPVGPLKAQKTPAELASMKDAFRRADQVVYSAIQWVNREVDAGRRVTEASFADRVERTFRAHGAVGLSFKVISAAGKNGAIIHYSDPSSRRVLKSAELMLLDTGGYFAEGYATDLTRTFLVGGARVKATETQRRYYTLVLKAAIAGMRAVFPQGTTGAAIDALVRAPLWAEGLNYAHGTGHGVGINVHESPPRIAPAAGGVPLEPGYVFSIEPGVYLPAFGGVRIENLCTVQPAKGRKGFLEVVPLTFSPLDKRLIDTKRLDSQEKQWLQAYSQKFKPATITVEGPAPTTRGPKKRARPTPTGRRKAARRPSGPGRD